MYFLCILPGDFQVVRLLYQRSTKTSLAIQSRIAVTEWLHQLSTVCVLWVSCFQFWGLPWLSDVAEGTGPYQCEGAVGRWVTCHGSHFVESPKGWERESAPWQRMCCFGILSKILDRWIDDWWGHLIVGDFVAPIGVSPHVGVLYCFLLESEHLLFNLDSWPRWWLCYYIVFLFWTTQLSLQHDRIFLHNWFGRPANLLNASRCSRVWPASLWNCRCCNKAWDAWFNLLDFPHSKKPGRIGRYHQARKITKMTLLCACHASIIVITFH